MEFTQGFGLACKRRSSWCFFRECRSSDQSNHISILGSQPKGEITFLIEGKPICEVETPSEGQLENEFRELISNGHTLSTAQKELVRLQKVVQLQAAVRGHLVRCQAAGTLRCVQAIVKMQTLVRARHANLSVGKVSTGKKGIQDTRNKPHPMYISIEKLLSNRFAIQIVAINEYLKQVDKQAEMILQM